jgi:hypothetical protein
MVKKFSYSKQGNEHLSAHFQVREFASKSGSKLYSDDVYVDTELITVLEKIFDHFNCGMIIVSSGYRTSDHDKAVGGNGSGQHTRGCAADFTCKDKANNIISAKLVCCYLEDLGINGIGYINSNYTHVDTRTGMYKWWGDETKPNSPSITKFGYNSFYTYFSVPKTAPAAPSAPVAPTVAVPTPKLGLYVNGGVDYGYVFDHNFYADRYADDLKKAFGYDKTKLFNHFIKYGMKEKRRGNAYFDVEIYINAKDNADLRTAFGGDVPSYYKHYSMHGHNEPRICR